MTVQRNATIGLFLLVVLGNGVMLWLFSQQQDQLAQVLVVEAQRTTSFCEDRLRENAVIAEIMGGLATALEADGATESADVLRNPPEGFGSEPIECRDSAILEELE